MEALVVEDVAVLVPNPAASFVSNSLDAPDVVGVFLAYLAGALAVPPQMLLYGVLRKLGTGRSL